MRGYGVRGDGVRGDEVRLLEGAAARAVPFVVRRSLRRGLHGVWAKGDWGALPPGGLILAANHHSWWDPYLMWYLGRVLERPLSGLMLEATLARFPFFRPLGALGRYELREALRRLGRGEVLVVFPEGALAPVGPVRRVQPGAAFLARKARVPVYPLAVRVVLRGAQHPEALLALGEVVGPGLEGDAAASRRVRDALNTLLSEVDEGVCSSDPEAPPPGFARWSPGARSFHERVAWLGRVFR